MEYLLPNVPSSSSSRSLFLRDAHRAFNFQNMIMCIALHRCLSLKQTFISPSSNKTKHRDSQWEHFQTPLDKGTPKWWWWVTVCCHRLMRISLVYLFYTPRNKAHPYDFKMMLMGLHWNGALAVFKHLGKASIETRWNEGSKKTKVLVYQDCTSIDLRGFIP
jgi:hypothetical protein